MDLCFYIRRNDAVNKSGQTSIYCTITVNSTATVPFSTGIKVIAANWQPKRKTTNDENADNVRREINQIESLLRKIKVDLQESEKMLTANSIKEKFMAIRKQANEKQENKVKFMEILKIYLANKTKKGIKKTTKQGDDTHQNNLERYLKKIKKNNLAVDEIDLDFIDNFILYFEHDLGESRNYTNRHIGLISNVLDMCVMKKIIKYNFLHSLKLNYEHKTDTKALTTKEIEMLESAKNLSDIEQKSVDIFLFMCGTGCDYCDFMELKENNIIRLNGKVLIRHLRQKTVTYLKRKPQSGNPIVKDFALRIIEKYGGIENMPKMSLKKINENLKIIGERFEIKTKLTTKRGRKTFTYISINKELHTDEQTAYQLGHSSTNQLKHYRSYDEEILRNLLE